MIRCIKPFGKEQLIQMLKKNRLNFSGKKNTFLSLKNLEEVIFAFLTQNSKKVENAIFNFDFEFEFLLKEKTDFSPKALNYCDKLSKELIQIPCSDQFLMSNFYTKLLQQYFCKLVKFKIFCDENVYILNIFDVFYLTKTQKKELKDQLQKSDIYAKILRDNGFELLKYEECFKKWTTSNLDKTIINKNNLLIRITGPLLNNFISFQTWWEKMPQRWIESELQLAQIASFLANKVSSFCLKINDFGQNIKKEQNLLQNNYFLDYFQNTLNSTIINLESFIHLDKMSLLLLKKQIESVKNDPNFKNLFEINQIQLWPFFTNLNDIYFEQPENDTIESSFFSFDVKILNFVPMFYPNLLFFFEAADCFSKVYKENKKSSPSEIKNYNSHQILLTSISDALIKMFENQFFIVGFEKTYTDPFILARFLITCQNLNNELKIKEICQCFFGQTASIAYLNEKNLCLSCLKIKKFLKELMEVKFVSSDEREFKKESHKMMDEQKSTFYIPKRRYFVPTPENLKEKPKIKNEDEFDVLMQNPTNEANFGQVIFMEDEFQDQIEKKWKKKFDMNFRMNEKSKVDGKKGIYVDILKKEDILNGEK